jgi:hypothetical protein
MIENDGIVVFDKTKRKRLLKPKGLSSQSDINLTTGFTIKSNFFGMKSIE